MIRDCNGWSEWPLPVVFSNCSIDGATVEWISSWISRTSNKHEHCSVALFQRVFGVPFSSNNRPSYKTDHQVLRPFASQTPKISTFTPPHAVTLQPPRSSFCYILQHWSYWRCVRLGRLIGLREVTWGSGGEIREVRACEGCYVWSGRLDVFSSWKWDAVRQSNWSFGG
jgi:hypothetical protein